MILYLRYCRAGVLFHITVHVKDQYVTTCDDVILVKPNRICSPMSYVDHQYGTSTKVQYWSTIDHVLYCMFTARTVQCTIQ